MKKLYVQNLVLIITEKCNFNCKHCLHGKGSNKEIDDKVLNRLFSQIEVVSNLAISGGEPFLVPKKLESLFNIIKENKTIIDQYGLTTNGTLYSSRIEKIFDFFEEYVENNSTPNIRRFNSMKHGYIDLSSDKYHQEELETLLSKSFDFEYLSSIEALKKSSYYTGCKTLKTGLINIGNAKSLDVLKHAPQKIKLYSYDSNIMYVGPILMVSVDGNIVDYDSDYVDMTEHYYENIMNKSLCDIIESNSIKCKSLKHFYKKSDLELYKYKKIDNR